ncbi:selenide, water dikinase SelD [Gallaecimonas kandeliae]|uniref:selenide, water dikinase SelD n=1 Tax=Gallaecimonas kandeliae TaxID=3029055 RepID=UPI002647F5D4|nr:selenide, water dikinase SelD [Gallaecimonas kandeliae]WKE65948.1 selenide, water dikinase SelD [Gallaecimonas kandeliae]
MSKIRLTQYSHGAGCGCKISPKVLDAILAGSKSQMVFPDLLVGNDSKDDAAVVDLGDGTGIVSTTDFFMPIVDDPADFGRIAATNAISDIYAMGGTPLMAIAILGWPVNQIPAEVAGQVVAGGREVCEAAGIPLAGGHSIDAPEPIFGLAVTGRVPLNRLKRNGGAQPGDRLYLSKALGVGVLTTAEKKGLLQPQHQTLARDQMVILNSFGAKAADLAGVRAMTDVTGFGLAGHLLEMLEASGCSARLDFDSLPLLDGLDHYLALGAVPGGTHRNLDAYGHKLPELPERLRQILADPQTSGGLLIAVAEEAAAELEQLATEAGQALHAVGRIETKGAQWLAL